MCWAGGGARTGGAPSPRCGGEGGPGTTGGAGGGAGAATRFAPHPSRAFGARHPLPASRGEGRAGDTVFADSEARTATPCWRLLRSRAYAFLRRQQRICRDARGLEWITGRTIVVHQSSVGAIALMAALCLTAGAAQ